MIQAVASATDPRFEHTIVERREKLVSTVGQIIDADIWLWFTGVVNPEIRGDSMVVQYVSGGFANEREKAEFFRVTTHQELTSITLSPISDALANKKSITARRVDLIADRSWRSLPISKIWRGLGFEDFIITAVGVGDKGYSAGGFHRRLGKRRFTESERKIVQVLFDNVAWMHQSISIGEASMHVIGLSPRERQVVMFMIRGDRRKEIAQKLNLSEHTVSDYLKEIYRKFGVRSRAAFLAMFIDQKALPSISKQTKTQKLG